MDSLPLVLALVLAAGGWLLEVVSAKNIDKWLVANQVEDRRKTGWFKNFVNARLYWKARSAKKKSVGWVLIYFASLIASYGGIILLLYLKGSNRI